MTVGQLQENLASDLASGRISDQIPVRVRERTFSGQPVKEIVDIRHKIPDVSERKTLFLYV